MNITKWEKEFDEQFNHDEPNGRALVLFISNSDGSRSQAPAQELVKRFINENFIHKQTLKDEINEFSFCKKWELEDDKKYLDADVEDIINLID